MEGNRLRKKLKGQSGFSLAEMLLVVMIVLMVSAVVAAGIPAAVKAYNNVVDAANAQVLLSNTIENLKKELSTAKEVKPEGTSISYINGIGSASRLYVEEEDLYLQEYAYAEDGLLQPESTYHRLLTSNAASNKNLHVAFTGASAEDGILTIEGIQVTKNGKAITDSSTVCIRMIQDQLK